MKVNYDGQYGLLGNLKTILICRIAAVICVLGSIAPIFLPWIYAKVGKKEYTFKMLELFGFDSIFNKLSSYERTKTMSYSVFNTLFMISLVLFLVAMAVEVITLFLNFIKAKKTWTYSALRYASMFGIAASGLLLCMIMSLPNSKSKLFFQGLFKFKFAVFIPMFAQVLLVLLLTGRMVENAVAIGFYYPMDIPSMGEYKKFLAENKTPERTTTA